MILDALIENLKAEGLLQEAPRTHVVLAYSGGADSTALMFLLREIQSRFPLQVTVAYFNHQWRGQLPEELPLIHQNCLKCDMPLVVIQTDKNLPKTENAARQARYAKLTQLARNLHADAVLTAHHADDQIETLLFRILRGTGLDGLSGIQRRLTLDESAPGVATVPIFRPLLNASRKRLRQYVESQNIAFFNDPTNDDTTFQRNNIRARLLPMLEESFPQVKNALFRLSIVADGDLQILEETVDRIWKTVYQTDLEGPYLSALPFGQVGLAYQRRILKRFLGEQGIHADFQTIEDMLHFTQGQGRKNLDASLKSIETTADGKPRFLAIYKNRIRMIEKPDAASPLVQPVDVPGHLQIAELDMTFTAIAWAEPEKVFVTPIRPTDSQQVYVNFEMFQDKPLELRTRRPGDKFQPIGMEVPLRFKKFLINRGVPRFQRDGLKVLAHGNEILWVPGLGISQQIKVRDRAIPTHLFMLRPGMQEEPPKREYAVEVEREPIAEPEDLSKILQDSSDDVLEVELDLETDAPEIETPVAAAPEPTIEPPLITVEPAPTPTEAVLPPEPVVEPVLDSSPVPAEPVQPPVNLFQSFRPLAESGHYQLTPKPVTELPPPAFPTPDQAAAQTNNDIRMHADVVEQPLPSAAPISYFNALHTGALHPESAPTPEVPQSSSDEEPPHS